MFKTKQQDLNDANFVTQSNFFHISVSIFCALMSSASLIRFSSKDCLSTFHLSYLSVSLSLSLSLSNTHSNVPVRTHTHTSLVLAELSLTLVQRMSSFQRMCCNKLLIVLFSFFYSTFASQKVFVSIQIKARLTVGVIQPLSKKMA